MNSMNRIYVCRWLVPLALLAWGCGDPSAVDMNAAPPALLVVSKPPSGGSGGSGSLVVCSKLPYDSVTQVIGPAGGGISGGAPVLLGGWLAASAPRRHRPPGPVEHVRRALPPPHGLDFLR